jgi:ankyrin repeat protein
MDLIEAVADVESCDVETLKRLIERGADVNYEESDGWTALFWAVNYGRNSICNFLLDHGADVNHVDDDGWTSLFWAVYNSRKSKIMLLLMRGANVNHKNNIGQSAIDYARNKSILKILCWRGATCGVKNKNKIIEMDGILLLIFCRILPVDQLREIHTKWIS